MFYKLNNDVPDDAERCNITDETSDNAIEINIQNKRTELANYRKVMTADFNVPQDSFFNAVPVNVDHLRAFIEQNGGNDLKACRIYITKDSSDPSRSDYQLLFVPCIPVNDQNGQLDFFKDNLGDDGASHTFSAQCKRPPGCGKGALLLDTV